MGNGVKTRNNFIVGGQTMKEQVFYVDNIKIVLKEPKKTLIEKLFIIFGIALPIINVIVFWFIVNGESIFLAFQEMQNGEYVWTFNNFRYIWDALKNPMSPVMEGFKNTMIFFSFSTFVQLPTTYLIAFLVYKKIPFANGFRWIFMIPAMVSAVVLTSCVKFMLAPGGPLPEIWNDLFGTKPLFFADSDYALGTMLVYQYWAGFGGGILLYVANFSRIPKQLVEAGRLDGMSFFEEIIHVVFPLTWPFFSTMLMLQMSSIFGASGPVLLFTEGKYGTYTLSYWIYEQTISGAGLTKGACIGFIMTILTLPIILIFKKIADSVEPIEY